MDTLERVRTMLANMLNVTPDKVTPDASLIDDLDADSLDVVEITMAIEEEFDIKIYDDEAMTLKTVGQVVKYIETKTGIGATGQQKTKVEALR